MGGCARWKNGAGGRGWTHVGTRGTKATPPRFQVVPGRRRASASIARTVGQIRFLGSDGRGYRMDGDGNGYGWRCGKSRGLRSPGRRFVRPTATRRAYQTLLWIAILRVLGRVVGRRFGREQ